MAIKFIVEDGTGLSDATSYATIDQFKQYWLDRGNDYSTLTDDKIKGLLNRATSFVDCSYSFLGDKSDCDQALEWPRINVYSCYCVAPIGVPAEIINATCNLAGIANTRDIDPVNIGIQSETYGPVSQTFINGGMPEFREIDKILKKYIATGNQLLRVN